MKRYFIITIDTESDDLWDEALRKNISLKNIKEIPKLQALFNKFKVKPCYLITYPVANDKYAVSMFKEFLDESLCEIGIHLHSWTTPPIFNNEAKYNSFLHSFPKHIQKEKFNNLHNAIIDNLKIEPKSYRGGRYSFDSNTLEILEEKRYLLDSSVTPFNNWSHIGGPDYTDCIAVPYFPSHTDVLKKGDSGVLEVPISIGFDRNMPHSLKRLILRIPLVFHMQGILKRLKLCKLIWLDPSFQTFLELKMLVDSLLDVQQHPYVNLMFHSSVLLAGGTPYTRTERDVFNFYNRLESVLFYMTNDRNMINLTPKDFTKLYSSVSIAQGI